MKKSDGDCEETLIVDGGNTAETESESERMAGMGAFCRTKVLEIVKKHDSGGLVWKRIKLTSTRKLNAKKRLLRVWQNEAVLKACSETPPSITNDSNVGAPKTGETS